MVKQILFKSVATGIETAKVALFSVVERYQLNSDDNKRWESIANKCD